MIDYERETAADGSDLFTNIYTSYITQHLSDHDRAVLQDLIDQGIEFHKFTEHQVANLFW